MGALRAAEIPRVVGIGRVFEMYRTGAIERDDEVALLFAPETYQPLTVPLINVRYAVERLVRSATLNRRSGISIIEACSQLHYTERTYRNILRNSKLAQNTDVEDIIKLLRTIDLKRDDAQCLLETIVELKPSRDLPRSPVAEPGDERIAADIRVHDRESAEAAIMVWESGDCVDFGEQRALPRSSRPWSYGAQSPSGL